MAEVGTEKKATQEACSEELHQAERSPWDPI
jgi:hypothetical protein